MTNQTELRKITKEYGFHQYKRMADRFVEGNGIATVRNGSSWSDYYLYILGKSGEITELTNNVKYHRLCYAHSVIAYVYFDKKSKLSEYVISQGIDIKAFLGNLLSNGYNSARVTSSWKRGQNVTEAVKQGIGIAHHRHSYTDYDAISKKNMSDQEVRSLRRSYS